MTQKNTTQKVSPVNSTADVTYCLATPANAS